MISLLSTSKEPLSPPSDLTSGRTTVNCLNKQIKNINYENEYSFTNIILSKGTIQDKRLLDQQVCSILFSFICTEQNVEEICSKHSIPVCFGVERLAKEGIISYRSKLYNTYKESI